MTPLAPGDHLDRYELLCILAQGGMGTVWLARMSGKLGFERLVALKTILPIYSGDRQFCDMFLDEARIAAQIDHENVARILEIGEDRGLLYYAMELIDGESLRKLYRDVRAQKQAFPVGVALRIVADACAGLHATHELHSDDGHPLQVVHRDVSPQNLLVSVRGTTKLIDFGVAKANARRSEATAAGTLKGKIEYMAPEQARGEPLDRRADVYSLGAVLYELLAGRPVRDTDEGRQLIALHELMTGAPYLPLPDHVPPLIRGIVARALARDPQMRFGSSDELRLAIEQAMVATGQGGASHDDVANVLARFSRERTAKRKDAIERALQASAEGRLNAATIVAPLSSHSLGSGPGALSSDSGSVPPVSGVPPVVPPVITSSTRLDGPATGPSMQTIGPASVNAEPMRGSAAAKVFGAVLLLAAVAVLGVAAGVMATRRGEHVAAAAARRGAVTSASVEPPAPTDPLPPAVVLEPSTPSAPSAGDAPARGKDGGAAATGSGAGSTRRPSQKPPVKPGAKQGDGDEYGF